MSPIIPGIISKKNPSKRKTYKSAQQPNINTGGAKKEKKKRAPSAYNMFMKKFFADNKNMGKDGMKLCAAAYKKSKSGGQDTHVMPDGAVHS